MIGEGLPKYSATIHQFPLGGRASISNPRSRAFGERTRSDAKPKRILDWSASYHAAAIEEDAARRDS